MGSRRLKPSRIESSEVHHEDLLQVYQHKKVRLGKTWSLSTNWRRTMVTKFVEKAEVFTAFLPSTISCKTNIQELQTLENKNLEQGKLTVSEEKQNREQLNWICKPMRPDRMHTQVLRS